MPIQGTFPGGEDAAESYVAARTPPGAAMWRRGRRREPCGGGGGAAGSYSFPLQRNNEEDKIERACLKHLDQIILEIPHLFLKKIPYAWVGVVFFWSWPPVVSASLLAIIVLGTLVMIRQEKAWQSKIIRERHSGAAPILLDRPHVPRQIQMRNLVLVLAGSALLGWLLNGRLEITGIQWFFLLAGFMLLYKDTRLFGAGVTYLITDEGVGIRYIPGHVDYRIFIKYGEIRQATRTEAPQRLPTFWDVLTPSRNIREGILLSSNRAGGFSKQIQSEVFISPTEVDGFLRNLSAHVPVLQNPVSMGEIL